MKRHFALVLPAAFALLLGACNSDNKPVETTREDNSASGDTAVVVRTGPDAEAMYRQRARRIADRVYTDLKVKDTTVRTRIQTVYYNRAKRYGDLRTQYQTDTTGQYQAMRQADMETDQEVQTILTDPQMYKQYQAHRTDYSDDKYMDGSEQMNADGSTSASGDGTNNASATNGSMNADGSMASGAGTSGSGTMSDGSTSGDKTKAKIKAEDGSKVKIKNGDMKYKDADGNKTKVNGD